MTSRANQKYDIYLNTPQTGLVCAANAVLVEEGGLLTVMGLRYTKRYLSMAGAFALDPVQFPLSAKEYQFRCHGGLPGLLDDYLPDDWGRRVLTHIAYYRDGRKLNKNSSIDILSMLGNSRIGAIQWVLAGDAPSFELGTSLAHLESAELAAFRVDQPEYAQESPDEVSLLYLANNGTGVGGARPKALIFDGNQPYLAKFNRTRDAYNNARVEHACINMAKEAGLNIYDGFVKPSINGREVLLLNRFDVVAPEYTQRRHVISVNSLLKSKENQSDVGEAFRYNHIFELVIKYSDMPQYDLEQLVTLMIFNRAINNTDDHERNFSFIYDEKGFHLAPAYDLVPSLVLGEYHSAGFGYTPSPPSPTEIRTLGKVFHLSPVKISTIADRVVAAVNCWQRFAVESGMSAKDTHSIQTRITL